MEKTLQDTTIPEMLVTQKAILQELGGAYTEPPSSEPGFPRDTTIPQMLKVQRKILGAVKDKLAAGEEALAKVPEFSGSPAVGQIFQVSAVGENGKVTMEPMDMPGGAAHWETVVDEVWDKNKVIRILSYDADTALYEVQAGCLDGVETGVNVQCMAVAEESLTNTNQLLNVDMKSPNEFKKIDDAHISLAPETVPASTVDYSKFHIETLGVPNFTGINSRKIKWTIFGGNRTLCNMGFTLGLIPATKIHVPYLDYYAWHWPINGVQETTFEMVSDGQGITAEHKASFAWADKGSVKIDNYRYKTDIVALTDFYGIACADGKIMRFAESQNDSWNARHTIPNGARIILERWVE